MRCAIATIMICALGAVAGAAMQTDVGVLTCTLAEQSKKDTNPDSQTLAMHCSFKPKGTGPEETYIGEITKVGSQSELNGKLVLIWAVMGPSDRKLKPAVLQQTFVSEAAPDPLGKAQPPRKLVGERDKAYGLQPIGDESQGSTRSVTVVELRIKSTPS